jgi:hypothetical protein
MVDSTAKSFFYRKEHKDHKEVEWRSLCPLSNITVSMASASLRERMVYYLHGDHLGSNSVTTTSTGAINGSRVYYHAYGTTHAGNTADLKSDRTPSSSSGQASPARNRTAPGSCFSTPGTMTLILTAQTKRPARELVLGWAFLQRSIQSRVFVLGRRLHEGGEFGCVHAGDVRDGGEVKATRIHRQGNL